MTYLGTRNAASTMHYGDWQVTLNLPDLLSARDVQGRQKPQREENSDVPLLAGPASTTAVLLVLQ